MCGCGCGVVSSWSLGCASVWDMPSVMSRDTGDMDGFGTIFKSQWWEKDTVSDSERVTLGLSTQMKAELRNPKHSGTDTETGFMQYSVKGKPSPINSCPGFSLPNEMLKAPNGFLEGIKAQT